MVGWSSGTGLLILVLGEPRSPRIFWHALPDPSGVITFIPPAAQGPHFFPNPGPGTGTMNGDEAKNLNHVIPCGKMADQKLKLFVGNISFRVCWYFLIFTIVPTILY